MRNLVAGTLAAAALSFALAGMPAVADTDPTVTQIYDAAQAGHLDQAQRMIEQVLRDHPASSKAHYVQAELYAREGNPGLARSELARAEQLDPGLTKENPRAVQQLRAELGLIHRADRPYAVPGATQGVHIPWGTIIVLALVVGVFWMLFRRRRYVQPYAAGGPPMAGPGAPGGYGGYPAGPGGGGYGGPGAGGIGSSVAGGLAGGLAAGAGIVAGEELAHHFLDNGQRAPTAPPVADDASWGQNSNSDMGGNDFGVNDPSSWDDGSGGGGGDFGGDGGGGDGWT